MTFVLVSSPTPFPYPLRSGPVGLPRQGGAPRLGGERPGGGPGGRWAPTPPTPRPAAAQPPAPPPPPRPRGAARPPALPLRAGDDAIPPRVSGHAAGAVAAR